MKPDADLLISLCPEVDEVLIREHISRLEERYFELFDADQIAGHLKALNRLTINEPVQVLLKQGEQIECTVLAFNYPGEFSAIAGILAASGFSILSGEVFTYSKPVDMIKAPQKSHPAYRRRQSPSRNLLQRRRIIDLLSGNLESAIPFEIWENRLMVKLNQTIRLLEKGDSESLTRAKQIVNEQVAEKLSALKIKPRTVLYPVNIDVDNSEKCTRLKVTSEDTPFFLYALSTALSLKGISIEHIRIRTIENRIEDEFSFLDVHGKKILEPDSLNQVKLSVLLTKQFTYFLGGAPDPYAALERFEFLVEEVFTLPEQGRWFDLLSNPLILKDLARILGASNFLWEDFIRLQYETLLPMLEPHVQGKSFAEPVEKLRSRLNKALDGSQSLKDQGRILNEFKDREIFLLELDHILTPASDFEELSRGLTLLAEAVINAAVRLTENRLKTRYGTPGTVAGLEARYTLFGLGKFGGGELGYASDIELLFVYSDAGFTQGTNSESIPNTEFFERLAKESCLLILAKQEGIFHIDLRLRPYGASGPFACSLESFCRYYGSGGEAHSLERLSLVRLRVIGGDTDLGLRIERIRDELIYSTKSINLEELRAARKKQMLGKIKPGRLNAKFSPGALLDLESTVLLLQIMFGDEYQTIRTPRIREAIIKLSEEDIINPPEEKRISTAYDFFRRLINGLRMLRGSARDLLLPDIESDEYIHLARRMGYRDDQELTPAQRLHTEFETHTASIRVFVENHLGRESLPGPEAGNIADLILSEKLPLSLQQKILKNTGFKNTKRAYTNLQSLAGSEERRNCFAKLAVLAADILKNQPDPDMALNNWERFTGMLSDPDRHFRLLLAQPRRLEILLNIFAGSQFFSDTLIRNPDFFEWATRTEHLHRIRSRQEMVSVFRERIGDSDLNSWLSLLRRYRRREILRIGIRDICLGVPIEHIMQELSMLAEAVIQAALYRIRQRQNDVSDDLCIIAFGKLGGNELNYSSDIDLLGITQDNLSPASKDKQTKVMEMLKADLSAHSEEGYAYRVDLRLRPYGESGELIHPLNALRCYYEQDASIWEIQALLKANPAAGSIQLGRAFKRMALKILTRTYNPDDVIQSIKKMRRETHLKLSKALSSSLNIKLSPGGIRDIEFLVQGLQLINAHALSNSKETISLSGNTLKAIMELKDSGVIDVETASQLKRDYLFLRRIEHYLQIFEDRQIHTLPEDPSQLEALAGRMLGAGAETNLFLDMVHDCINRTQKAFEINLLHSH